VVNGKLRSRSWLALLTQLTRSTRLTQQAYACSSQVCSATQRRTPQSAALRPARPSPSSSLTPLALRCLDRGSLAWWTRGKSHAASGWRMILQSRHRLRSDGRSCEPCRDLAPAPPQASARHRSSWQCAALPGVAVGDASLAADVAGPRGPRRWKEASWAGEVDDRARSGSRTTTCPRPPSTPSSTTAPPASPSRAASAPGSGSRATLPPGLKASSTSPSCWTPAGTSRWRRPDGWRHPRPAASPGRMTRWRRGEEDPQPRARGGRVERAGGGVSDGEEGVRPPQPHHRQAERSRSRTCRGLVPLHPEERSA